MICKSGFESTFRGNIDGAYRATNADELSAIFDTLANTFTEDVQTDADSSHSIKVLDSNNELKEYSIEDVYSIVLSLQEDKDSSSSSIVELKFEEVLFVLFGRTTLFCGSIINVGVLWTLLFTRPLVLR